MTRLGTLVALAVFPFAGFSTAEDAIVLSPALGTRLAVGQRFDVRAALPGATQVRWLVTLEGQQLQPSEPGSDIWLRRDFELKRAGSHTLRAEARNAEGALLGRVERELTGIACEAVSSQRARNIIVLIGDGMGLAHRVAARIFLHGLSNGRPAGRLAIEKLPVAGFLSTSSLSGLVTDSAASAHAYATGTKTGNGMLGVFPDETTKDASDNARVEALPSLLARTRGTAAGLVTTANVVDATPAAFIAHTADRDENVVVADHLVTAARVGYLRVLLGGGLRNFTPNGNERLRALTDIGFAAAQDATELNAALAKRPTHLVGLFQSGHMNTAFDTQRRGDPEVVKAFPDQPTLEAMTRAALAVLERAPRGFFLMVEGAHIDRQSHYADQERMVWEVLAFDRAVAAAVAYAQGVNNDGNPSNDTLVIVTADHETGGVVIPGVGIPARFGSRDYVGIYDSGGLPDAADANGDGFPDDPDPAHKPIIHFGAGPDRYEDWRSQARPVSVALGKVGKDRVVIPNPERDGGSGVLLGGVIPTTVPADEDYSPNQFVHTAIDVPVGAYGPGAEALAGAHDNTDVFFAILSALGYTPAQPKAGTHR